MLIESLIKRAEGSFVTLGKDTYHFFNHIKGDNRHVSEVIDEDHIQTFLAIKEGYRIAKPLKKATADSGEQGNGGAANKPATTTKASKAATTATAPGISQTGEQGNGEGGEGDGAAGAGQ